MTSGYFVALFTRAWIEINSRLQDLHHTYVALFTRAWIEIDGQKSSINRKKSPSSRGRGLKYNSHFFCFVYTVSPSSRGRGLKCRKRTSLCQMVRVALFTRAWIEMLAVKWANIYAPVALFTRAWIEILYTIFSFLSSVSPSSRGRGLK